MVRLHEWEGMWRDGVWRDGCCVLWKGMCLDDRGGFCVIGIDCVEMLLVVDNLFACF